MVLRKARFRLATEYQYIKELYNINSSKVKKLKDKQAESAIPPPPEGRGLLALIMNNGKLPPCKISQKDINSVIAWAKGNTNLLLQLKDQKISGKLFKKQMLKLNDVKVLLDSELNKPKEDGKINSSIT